MAFSQKVWNSSFRIFILLPAIFYPFPHFCRFSSDKMFGHMPSWKAGTITNCSGLSSLAAHDFSHILHCNRKLDFLIFEATPPMNYRSAELLLRTLGSSEYSQRLGSRPRRDWKSRNDNIYWLISRNKSRQNKVF